MLQGYNLGGVPLLMVGAGKGLAGAFVRPSLGVCELASKTAYGLSLACLGKQGIVGTVQRRVRPPGAAPLPDEESLLDMVGLKSFLKGFAHHVADCCATLQISGLQAVSGVQACVNDTAMHHICSMSATW